MSKTLNTSKVTATPTTYINAKPIVLVEIDLSSTVTKYYADMNVTIESRPYYGKVTNVGTIIAAIGAGLDNVTIELENTESIDGTRVSSYINSYGLLKKKVRIYQYFDGELLADRDLLFYGVIIGSGAGITYTKTTIGFEVEDISATYHKDIGISFEEAGYTNAPDDTKPKMLPLVYGKQKSIKLQPVNQNVKGYTRFPIAATDTSIVLTDNSPIADFPAPQTYAYEYVLIGGEVIKYSSISDNTINVSIESIGSLASVDATGEDSVLTGSSTSWLSTASKGDLIRVSADTTSWNQIKSVDSNEQITVYGPWRSATTSGTLQKSGRGQSYSPPELGITAIEKSQPAIHEAGAQVSLLQTCTFIGAAGTNRSESNLFADPTISNLQTVDYEGTLRPLATKFPNGASCYLLPGIDLDKPADPILLRKWDLESEKLMTGIEPQFKVGDHCATGLDTDGSPLAFFVIGANTDLNRYQVYMYAPKLGCPNWKKVWDTSTASDYLDVGTDGITTYNTLGGIANFDKDGKVCWVLGYHASGRRMYIYDYITNTFSYKDMALGSGSGELQYVFSMISNYKGDDDELIIRLNSIGSNSVSTSYPVVMSIGGLEDASPTLFGDTTYLSALRGLIYPTIKTKVPADWNDNVDNDTSGSGMYCYYSGSNLRFVTGVIDPDTQTGLSADIPAAYTQDDLDIITSVYDPYRRYSSFQYYDTFGGLDGVLAFTYELVARAYCAKYSTDNLYGMYSFLAGNYQYKLRSSTTDEYPTLGDAVDFEKAYASCIFSCRGNDERVYVGLVENTDGAKVNVDVYAVTSDTSIVGTGTYSSGTGYLTDTDALFLSDVKVGQVFDIVNFVSATGAGGAAATFTVQQTKTITAADIISDTVLDMDGLTLSDGTRYMYRLRSGRTKTTEKVAQITLDKPTSVNDLYCQSFISGNDLVIIPSIGATVSAYNYQIVPLVETSLVAQETNVGAVFSHWPTVPKESTNYVTIEQALDSGYDNSYNTVNGVSTVHYKICGNRKLHFTDTNGQLMYHTVNGVAASNSTDERASKVVVRADELGHTEGDFRLLTNTGTRVREAYVRVNYHALTDAIMDGDSIKLYVSGSSFDVQELSGSDYVWTSQTFVELPMLEEAVPGSSADSAPVVFSVKVQGITDIKELIRKDITLEWNGSSATSDILITEVAWDVVLYEDVTEDLANIYADICLATGDFYASGETQGSSTYDNYTDGINPVRVIHDIVESGFDGYYTGASLLNPPLYVLEYAGKMTETVNNVTYAFCPGTAPNCLCFKSINQGRSWQYTGLAIGTVVTSAQAKPIAAHQTDDGVIWAGIGVGGYRLVYSTDYGATFTEVTPPASFYDVLVLDATTVLICGSNGSGYPTVWKTTDSGSSWTDIVVDTVSATASSMVIDSNGTIYVNTGTIYTSTDDGDSWTSTAYTPSGHTMYKWACLTDDTVIYVGYNGTSTVSSFYYSDDGAKTFTNIGNIGTGLGTPSILEVISNTSFVVGFASGTAPNLVYITKDSGKTWASLNEYFGLLANIEDMAFLGGNTLAISGYSSGGVGQSIYSYLLPRNYGTLGLSYTSVIDQTSFTAASQKLKTNLIKFNGALVQKMSSKDILEKICFEARLHHWWNEEGKFTIEYKEDMSTLASASTDRTIDATQVMDLRGPAITIPLKVFSKFTLKYDRIRLSQDEQNNYESELARDFSHKRSFGLVDEGDIETVFIADEGTARKLVQQIIDYNTTEYKLFSLECTLNDMMVERMDIITTTGLFENISKGFVQEIRRTFGQNRYFFMIRKVV